MSQACSWYLCLALRGCQPASKRQAKAVGGHVWVGRRVCLCMRGRLFCFLPPRPALDLWPSLLTGLDTSNSILPGLDLMWGWPLQASRAGVRRGAGGGAWGPEPFATPG